MTDGRCRFGPRAKREMIARMKSPLRERFEATAVAHYHPTVRAAVEACTQSM